MSSRPISNALKTAIAEDVVNHFFAIDVVLLDSNDAEETVRLWTGIGDKTINSQVYTGAGDMLSISGIDEAQDLGMSGITIGFAMNSTFLANFTNRDYQGLDVEVYLVFTDSSNVVLDTMPYFSGYTDQLSFRQSGDTANLTLKAENKLIKFSKSSLLRYNAQDQKRYHSTDTGFDRVATIQDQKVLWGQS